MALISELVRGRKMVVHNNLIGDAKLMDTDYVDADMLLTAIWSAHARAEELQPNGMLAKKPALK